MKKFRRRTYTFPGLFKDIFTVLKHPVLAFAAMWGKEISSSFRQRLMLAVTAVNGCRYCTYLHTREALHAGLSEHEIALLLGKSVEMVPANEVKAILYAQYWADNNARPELSVRKELLNAYGLSKSRLIEMILTLIRIGNLVGNCFDCCLFTISRGRWGA